MDSASRAATNGGVSPPPVAGLEDADRSDGGGITAAIMAPLPCETTKMVSDVKDISDAFELREAGGSSTEATMAPPPSESTKMVSAVKYISDAFQFQGTSGSSMVATMAPPPSESTKLISTVKEISDALFQLQGGCFVLADADEGSTGRLIPYSVPISVVRKGATASASYHEHLAAKRRCKTGDGGNALKLQKLERRKERKAYEEQTSPNAAKKCLVVMDKSVARGPGQDLNADMLMDIFRRLDPDILLRMGTVCRFFRELICLPDFRCWYRENQNGKMLGFFVKTKGRNSEQYPFVRCVGLPTPFLRASEVIHELWSAADTSPNNYWRHSEVLDSRDGKLLMLAGNSSRDPDMFVFYPHARTNRHHQIPHPRLFNNFRIVAAALIPNDHTHQYKVIILGRTGVADYKMKSNAPLTESLVGSFSSSVNRWVKASTLQFAMPAKQMLRMGSVLIDETIHFLHSGKQVISVDIPSLKLGTTQLPDHVNKQIIKSRMTHVLFPGPSNQLCLSVASRMSVSIYTYMDSSMSWEHTRDWVVPIGSNIKDKAVKLVGSAENEGLLLLKIGSQDVFSIETRTGLVKWIANCESDEVLAYEQECPVVSQMLRG
ncbi:hypothetical protein EJB05_39509 [Eragrostis curvula]|uniref:F-box domain-containing protein n=1 Tax=Eragrostis curvula TaxID=38414 RepID=A0A5J9TX65_9POAL|nr:hypothetical protein EJB05_39509 [Eragrostis curvula]